MAQPDYKSPLEDKWYKSLESGSPDYSIYDHDFYLSEAWSCWLNYSRKYLQSIKLDKSMYVKSVVSDIGKIDKIVDLGCGLGYTSAALSQIFEGSSVIGTNIEGSKQSRFVQALAEVYDFQLHYDLSKIDHADLIFASEYFEHFLDPIAHLREVIEKLSPKFILIANSFGVRAPGHFINYIDNGKEISGDKISRLFNQELERLGYDKMKVRIWNNRPAYYKSREY
jgi:SAM-dependent methyltransferase